MLSEALHPIPSCIGHRGTSARCPPPQAQTNTFPRSSCWQAAQKRLSIHTAWKHMHMFSVDCVHVQGVRTALPMPASLKLCMTATLISKMTLSRHMLASLLVSRPRQAATSAHMLYRPESVRFRTTSVSAYQPVNTSDTTTCIFNAIATDTEEHKSELRSVSHATHIVILLRRC